MSDDNLAVFRLIVEQVPDAVIFANRQVIIQVWNNAAREVFGYAPDEVVGGSLDVIIPAHLDRAGTVIGALTTAREFIDNS
jgi:PAS domain S-box-containing protein